MQTALAVVEVAANPRPAPELRIEAGSPNHRGDGVVRILAIDPGTSCGWAVSDGPSGTWDLSVKRGESPGMRYIRLRGCLVEMRRCFPDIGLLAFEKSFQRGQAAREIHLKLVGTLEVWCAEESVELTHVYAATLKKYATGSGRASKEEMCAAWWLIHPADRNYLPRRSEDEIDALWILRWAMETTGKRRSA
jgi:Holliday junction resolvasome RuvABC endonuclease subunit